METTLDIETKSEFLDRLRAIFPEERLIADSPQLSTFESDGLTAFAVSPLAVVMPKNEEEIVECLKLCNEFEVPFVARGSGTSLSGGSLPIENGIVVALNQLNQILEIDPVDRIAIVQPGVINSAVSRGVESLGLHFAPDPSSQQVCTVGGNLAFNAGGAHCLKYGMTSNHILGARVVLGDGSVVQLGSRSTEHCGADSIGLFVGSEGLMGIAVEITLRLIPKPEAYFTILIGYKSVDAAGDAVSKIIGAGLLPGAMEIMDRTAMRAAELGVGAEYPEGSEAVLIVELDGSSAGVEEERLLLNDLIDPATTVGIKIAKDTTERLKIWKGRKCVFSAVGHLSPDFIVQDGVVPRNRLGEALRRIAAISAETNVPVANVFHAGDGNLHPLVLFDGREEGALHRAEATAARIVQVCIELGGSITGEHGVGMEKRQFLSGMFDEKSLDAMKRIRLECDPLEISNRGKMFPSGEADALSLYGQHPLEKSGVAFRM